MTWTAAAATAAAASLYLFSRMDANPSLYFFDLVCHRQRRLQQFGTTIAGETPQKIWITGASSGIGAVLARRLSTVQGISLVLSSRPSERLHKVARECRESCSSVQVVEMDMMAPPQELERIVQKEVGDVDCVFLNAGQGQLAPAIDTSLVTTQQLMHVNAFAPISIAQCLLQREDWKKKNSLTRQRRKRIVVTSSVASLFPVPLSSSYAASKCAVHGYFSTLRVECPHLIIDLPCPGPVASNFHHAKATEEKDDKGLREWKMPVERCARLILSTMMSSSSSGKTTWIAEQPTLFFLTLNQFLPGVANLLLTRFVGPTRMGMFQEGLNLYHPDSIKEYRKIRQQQKQTKPPSF